MRGKKYLSSTLESRKGADSLYDFLVAKTTAVLAPKMGCDPGSATYDKLRYGTHVFYINALKTLLLVVVALILGILPYVAAFALAYGALRVFSFGVHLNNSLLCTAIGMVFYLGSVYLSLYVGIPLVIMAVLLLLSIVCFTLYAPAQTKKRPIPECQRKKLKRKSLIALTVVVCSVFALYQPFPVFSSLVCMAAVCQSVNLLPVTYKIFKE